MRIRLLQPCLVLSVQRKLPEKIFALVADTVTSALNGFGLEASESGRVADILAMSANKTAAGVGDLGYALKYAAPVASSLGIGLEELAAATGIMADSGLEGSQAGTTLRAVMTNLASPTDEARAAMEAMGFSAINADGSFKPLNQIIGDLNGSMAGMTDAQKLATLSTLSWYGSGKRHACIAGCWSRRISRDDNRTAKFRRSISRGCRIHEGQHERRFG